MVTYRTKVRKTWTLPRKPLSLRQFLLDILPCIVYSKFTKTNRNDNAINMVYFKICKSGV